MSEREALLRAICENPDEDTPRLVFADWLQENGEEERAEFIRLQCRLYQIEVSNWERGDEDTWATILARTEKMLEANREAWVGRLFRRTGLSDTIATWGNFERGFASQLSIWHASAFQTNWDRIFWASPLQDLSLSSVEEVGEALRHPSAARLRRLSLFSCELAQLDLLALVSPVRFPRLETFTLHPLEGRISPETEQRLRDRFGQAFELDLEPTHVLWRSGGA